jgi:hypothetical protein
MAECLIPPWVRPESPETIRLIDDATVAFQPAFGRGQTQRGIFADPRWGLRRRYRGLRSDEKAAILGVLNESRGQFNTIRLTPHTPIRGSFATGELLSNGQFGSSTTGWGISTSPATLSVSDRMLRVLQNASGTNPQARQSSVTVTQYVPYVARAMIYPGPGGTATRVFISDGTVAVDAAAASALGAIALVPLATTVDVAAYRQTTTGSAGDFFQVPYMSLARCALPDSGQNILVRSDDFATTWTTSALGAVGANAVVAPDGTTTGDTITETATTAAHFISQVVTVSSSAADYCFSVAVKGNLRSIVWIEIDPGTGAGGAYFDLNAQTVGDLYNGVSATNTRARITDLGNSWRLCSIVMRKTSASTSLTYSIGATTTNGIKSYTGSAASPALYLWRGTGAQSSVHTRLSQTTSAATTGTAHSGSGIYTKGWPVSMNGLLLAGDWIEMNGELKQLTAPVNSDGLGLAYLQFRPTLAGSPADTDPIVVFEPFGRFIYPGTREFENLFGIYGDCEMNLEEIYS